MLKYWCSPTKFQLLDTVNVCINVFLVLLVINIVKTNTRPDIITIRFTCQTCLVIWTSGWGMGTRKGKQSGLVQTKKDFSTQTSAKGGVTYEFERKGGLFDWLLWPFVILGFLTMAMFLLQVSFRGFENSRQTDRNAQKPVI